MTGVAFTPLETRVGTLVRLAQRADALGLDRVQIAEADAYDALLVLADIASRTSSIGVGTLSAQPHFASAAVPLQRGSGGRLALGAGASIATLTALRAQLGHEVPLSLDAHAPEAIRIAGGLADEWAPTLWPRTRLAEGRALLGRDEPRGTARAGGSPTRVVPVVPVALGPNMVVARRCAAWWLRTFARREPQRLRAFAGPVVIESLRMADRLRARELPAVAEPLARELTLFGTYDDAPALLAAWAAAGADRVQLLLPPEESEAQLTELVEVVAAARLASTS
ncbi:alkanesulfonate monooxygenase SsuD/methylene tetrahydromethanopterin reductase-like flavin-dependent oxidoreductase (luciferase family) [Solirubrobacter pauli]|uniref:Alkanesulfonate monooxygenase SsuD/methylene tetrahydromethanopterin reductase-like flavin-dependent oxidoreductase (Luciferase family) n=1 Tax=Solirubrobacter pauli TaxID=166793 RepID=A0A660KYK0_9ACTN|nr:LLM class flavin-dependent oxidoreductase [Solirubrobacter pauli]RKQ86024.1 alkanesulfonate monooxygenase SsuD/methylene tetrahydromethanopterin reductase-like flavin-dependent oxidoreductase (luciferase family) [Solirubrobacter pauli]